MDRDEPMWGKSIEADFEKGTWTFEMVGDDWEVSAGMYALLYNDDYQELADAKDDMLHADSLLLRVQQFGDRLPADLREDIERYFDPGNISAASTTPREGS